MKKLLAITLLLAMLFTLLACNASDSSYSDDDDEDEDDKVSDHISSGDVTIEETVICDQNGIKITVHSLEINEMGGYNILNVTLENSSDRNLTVTGTEFSVNDLIVSGTLYCELNAGATKEEALYISHDDLKRGGIELIQTMEFGITAFDPETYDTIFKTEPVMIQTSADPSYVQKYKDEGTLLYEDDNLRIVLQGCGKAQYLDAQEIYLFIENKSQQTWTIQCKEFAVNGTTVDPVCSSSVGAGKKRHDEIIIYNERLTEANIETIENFTVTFIMVDFSDWSTSYTTQSITADIQ